MAISQRKARQSPSGSKYKHCRKKKLHELGSNPTLTKLGESKSNKAKMTGGIKTRLLMANKANVLNPKTKKCVMAKITNVVGNPANRYFVRRNIITRGSVIDTDKGRARVTSRPGQEGTVNAVLITE